jgi:photosystem II PsbU protein
MKTLARILAILTLVVGCFGFIGQSQALPLPTSPILAELNAVDSMLTTDFGKKIDLNNSDIRDFRDLRGFYPNLAGKIIKNSPYDRVEDVLDISGLSETQKNRLQANLDNFTVTPPSKEFNEGGDRINPGVY